MRRCRCDNHSTILTTLCCILATLDEMVQTTNRRKERSKRVLNECSQLRVVLKRHFNGVANVTSAGTTDDKTFYKPAKHITGCTIRHLTS